MIRTHCVALGQILTHLVSCCAQVTKKGRSLVDRKLRKRVLTNVPVFLELLVNGYAYTFASLACEHNATSCAIAYGYASETTSACHASIPEAPIFNSLLASCVIHSLILRILTRELDKGDNLNKGSGRIPGALG
jgi:hypothetical protein